MRAMSKTVVSKPVISKPVITAQSTAHFETELVRSNHPNATVRCHVDM